MTILIENLNKTEELRVDFSGINIEDKIYSINLKTTNLVKHSLINQNPYMVSFIDSENLGLNEDAILMQYNSYNYSASTAFTVDEVGNQKEIIAVNSNTITFIKY